MMGHCRKNKNPTSWSLAWVTCAFSYEFAGSGNSWAACTFLILGFPLERWFACWAQSTPALPDGESVGEDEPLLISFVGEPSSQSRSRLLTRSEPSEQYHHTRGPSTNALGPTGRNYNSARRYKYVDSGSNFLNEIVERNPHICFP